MRGRCLTTLIVFLFGVLIGKTVSADTSHDTSRGYFISKNDQIYFTEKYPTTAPAFRVIWAKKRAQPPICAVNLVPSCRPVTLRFKRELIGPEKKREMILADASVVSFRH